jgi:hypothetical protein
MDIHDISDVNSVDISALPGPATSKTFIGAPKGDEVK